MAKRGRNGKIFHFIISIRIKIIVIQLFPDKAQIFIGALEDVEYKNQKINSWDDMWGFDAGIIKKTAIIEVNKSFILAFSGCRLF